MDENYLDNLLKEVSGGGSTNFDKIVEKDSSIDIDLSDLDTISLDELDDLDSLELGELDIDDIDFDDLDVTKIDTNITQPVNPEPPTEKETEDFNLDKLISALEEEDKLDEVSTPQDDAPVTMQEDSVFSDAEELYSHDIEEQSDTDDVVSDAESVNSMDLDDLFSALGISNDQEEHSSPLTANQEDFDQLFQSSMEEGNIDAELASLFDTGADISKSTESTKGKGKPKVKKSVTEILFGEPDEDDKEEEERYKLKKAEKQAKKEQKKADKEVKDAEKKEQLALKKEHKNKLKQEKNDKKRAINEEYEAELAKDKKVSTPVAILIFLGFAIIGFVVVFGSKNFNYSQVIKKATDYFERQRYRLAYDEVSGVEIKEDDEQLRDRIYTVMYVERLYESYENNITLNRYDKALDALLRGIEKYDEHYEEAVKLRIVKDINICKEKIVNALWNTYGISEERAYEIIELTGDEYLQALYECCEKYNIGE